MAPWMDPVTASDKTIRIRQVQNQEDWTPVGKKKAQAEDEKGEQMVEFKEGKPQWKYPDTKDKEYKDALEAEMAGQRASRDAHLSDKRFAKLVKLVRHFSTAFFEEGAPPTVIKGVEFDIELKEGAKPHKARQPKISPAEEAMQRIHIAQKLGLGHMSYPVVTGPWCTASKVVF
jgi:hypothetical protein